MGKDHPLHASPEAIWSTHHTGYKHLFSPETCRASILMDASIQEASKLPPYLELCDSKFTDVPALSSVFSKSFHPVSSFMKQAIPDTLQILQWWSEVNTLALNDPEFRIMKIVDTAADRIIVAYARWRLPTAVRSTAVDAGGWSAMPLTASHDEALCNAFINFMAEQRRTLMQDRPHYCKSLVYSCHSGWRVFNNERVLLDSISHQHRCLLL